MITAGIVGASGYTGEKIMKLLENHPKAKLSTVCSVSNAGKKISEVIPRLSSDLAFSKLDFDELNKLDCVFLAVPHGEAKPIAEKLSCKVIDLSADHRSTHPYGLTEIFKKEISNSSTKLIANPGCYATACILSAWPIRDKIDSVVFDCISGYSGGGKTNKYDYENNIIAYGLTNHFHKKEIQEKLGMQISFTPHVVNAFSGLMSTAHIKLSETSCYAEIMQAYSKAYLNSFTSMQDKIPCTKDVVDTPECKIGFEVDGQELIVISVLDNLMKGAASQAIENMNLMFGLNQKTGLFKGE
jgi:N-acetyl-gamma-glutamyl-phosphate reductase